MARTKAKKIETITGIGANPDEKLTIQKTHPIYSLWQSDLTLAEFKILDMYLARIDTRKPERRRVQLPKGELEAALGVSQIKSTDLRNRLKGLSQPIDLAKGNKRKIHLVGLFEEAEAEQDENGIWQVTLTCTDAAMKYFFDVEKLGYFRYKLRCITSLTSRYTYILFTYLEKNRWKGSWDESLGDLREILSCEEDYYLVYSRFREKILDRCQKELHQKTECRFCYTPIKKGRTVVGIHFQVESIAAVPEPVDAGQVAALVATDPDALAKILPSSFSAADIQATTLAATPVVSAMFSVADPRPAQIATYLAQKMAMLNAYDAKKPIKNKLTYLLRMIEQDLVRADAMHTQHTPERRDLSPDELAAIQRIMAEPDPVLDPVTAADDPDLAIRAEMLRDSLQK